MELKEVKKLKLNARNIRSTIFRGNNKLKKLRLKETNLLTRERDRKKKKKRENRVEAKGSLSNIGGVKKKIASKSKSIFDKIMEFFGLIAGGILISTLPRIIKSIRQFFIDHKELIDGIKEFFKVVGNAIKGFVAMFESSPLNKDQLEKDREELGGKIDEIKGSNGIEKLKKEAEKLEKLAGDKEKELKDQKKSDEGFIKKALETKNEAGNPEGVKLSKETSLKVEEEVNAVRPNKTNKSLLSSENNQSSNLVEKISSNESSLKIDQNQNKEENQNGNQNGNKGIQKLAKGGTVGVWHSPLGGDSRVKDTVNEFKTFLDNQIVQRDIIGDQEKVNDTFKLIVQDLTRLNLSTESNQEDNSEKIKISSSSLLNTYSPIESSVNQENNQSNTSQKESSNGKIIEYITGDIGHKNYREDHGGNTYHEHLAFSSTEERDKAAEKLRGSGFFLSTSFIGGTSRISSYDYSNQTLDVPFRSNSGRYEDSGEGKEQFSEDVRKVLISEGFTGSNININSKEAPKLKSSMISSKEFNVSKIQRASNISTEIDEDSKVLVLNRTEIIPFVVST